MKWLYEAKADTDEAQTNVGIIAISKGGVTLTPEQLLNEGDTITVKATIKSGYRLDGIEYVPYVNGTLGTPQEITKTDTGTFIMPSDNVLVRLKYTKLSHNITKDPVDATKGDFSVPNKGVENEVITINLSPKVGYDGVTVTKTDGTTVTVSGTGNTRAFEMPASNVTVSVEFKQINYKIKFNYTTNNADRPYDAQKMGNSTMTNHSNTIPMTTQVYQGQLRIYVHNKLGYKFKDIKIIDDVTGGIHYEQSNPTSTSGQFYSISGMPASDITVNLVIEPIEYSLSSRPSPSTGGTPIFTVNSTTVTNATIDDIVTIKANPNPGYEVLA